MTDTATARYGARQQSQGSNTNTWGDDKLNEVLRLFDRGSKGYQSLVLSGDTTLTWSNYVATNTGQCAVLVLTGSLSAAASLTVTFFLSGLGRVVNWGIPKRKDK